MEKAPSSLHPSPTLDLAQTPSTQMVLASAHTSSESAPLVPPWLQALGMPVLSDSYRKVPGTKQKCSLALLLKDKKPRAESGSLLYAAKAGAI